MIGIENHTTTQGPFTPCLAKSAVIEAVSLAWNAICRLCPPQGAFMNEQEFQAKLAELMGEISTLPPAERAKLERLADESRARHERLKATVSGLQESLDYL